MISEHAGGNAVLDRAYAQTDPFMSYVRAEIEPPRIIGLPDTGRSRQSAQGGAIIRHMEIAARTLPLARDA